MKKNIQNLIENALAQFSVDEIIDQMPDYAIEVPKQKQHGDYSTNIAMQLVKLLKKSPRDIATELKTTLEKEKSFFTKVEIAGPGFLNFYLQPTAYHRVLQSRVDDQFVFQIQKIEKKKKVLVEFVSANPTGPMHIGHARNAVVGDALASLFSLKGYEVEREFYVNDHGVQISKLGQTAEYYLAELSGVVANNAKNNSEVSYQGEFWKDIVEENKGLLLTVKDDLKILGQTLGKKILETIQATLKKSGVEFDHYFSESTLYESSAVEQILTRLKGKSVTYEKDEALWLASTDLGDDKDRVLIKKDGSYTYLTPDIAYHANKFERDFDLYVNVLGADHGGYLARIYASLKALDYEHDKLKFLLMQLVQLKAAEVGEKAERMSKRRGTIVLFDELLDAVGKDALRFFLLLRSHHVNLEFDLDLALKESSENPVYYVQYAHARLCQLLGKAKEAGAELKPGQAVNLSALNLPEELELVQKVLDLDAVLELAVENLEPHRLVFYLLDLAKLFQSYYTQGKQDERYRVLESKDEDMQAKLYLISVLKSIFKQVLDALGVNAPERM